MDKVLCKGCLKVHGSQNIQMEVDHPKNSVVVYLPYLFVNTGTSYGTLKSWLEGVFSTKEKAADPINHGDIYEEQPNRLSISDVCYTIEIATYVLFNYDPTLPIFVMEEKVPFVTQSEHEIKNRLLLSTFMETEPAKVYKGLIDKQFVVC